MKSLWILFLLAGTAHAGERLRLDDYVVKPGDTCAKIARDQLGSAKEIRLLHQHNPLGPLPHKLKPGQILKIPVLEDDGAPDAQVTRTLGKVQARPPETDWSPAPRGTNLWRAWRVSSLARAFAEITFRDASIVVLRENTVVVIYGPSARRRAEAGEARLEEGSLASRLGELAGDKTIDTPTSQVTLGSGTAVVGADASSTAVSNHTGRAARVRGRDASGKPRKKAVAVDAGMGSTVARDAEPSPPRPLPAAPAWSGDEPLFVSAPGDAAEVVLVWQPVAAAASYRVILSRDAAGTDPVDTLVVPASVTRFETRTLPEGAYFASVATLDADRLEGRPGPALPLRVTSVKLRPPAGTDGVPLGTRVLAPAGLECAPDVLDRLGQMAVSCGGKPLYFQVKPLPIRIEPVPPAPAGTLVTVRLDAPQALVPVLSVNGAPVVLTARGPAAQLRLTGEPLVASLVVDGVSVPVARVAAAIGPIPAALEPPRFGLGVYTGMFTFSGDEAFAEGFAAPSGNPGRTLALHLDLRAYRGLWLQLDLGWAFADVGEGDTLGQKTIDLYRARARYEIALERLRPFLGLGVSRLVWEPSGRDFDPLDSLELGGGALLDLSRRWALRVDVFARKPLGFAGVASEAQLGLQVGF